MSGSVRAAYHMGDTGLIAVSWIDAGVKIINNFKIMGPLRIPSVHAFPSAHGNYEYELSITGSNNRISIAICSTPFLERGGSREKRNLLRQDYSGSRKTSGPFDKLRPGEKKKEKNVARSSLTGEMGEGGVPAKPKHLRRLEGA